MKKLYISAVSLFVFAVAAHAQSLSPTVIASTGGYSTNGGQYTLSYTVGEMTMVQTFSAGNNILTQGFQQPNDSLVLGLLDLTQDEFGSFVVYPNPAVSNVWYGFSFPESGRLNISLYDVLGQKLLNAYEANYTTGKTVEQLTVSNYAAGMYFLNVSFISDKDGKTHTFSKKFQVINQ